MHRRLFGALTGSLLLALLTTLSACRKETAEIDLLTLLPAGPTYLVTVHAPDLTSAPLWAKVRERAMTLPGHYERFRQFLEQAGIDPERDLDFAVMAFYPRERKEGSFAALLTGRFDRRRLEEVLATAGLQRESYREVAVLHPAPGGPQEAESLQGWSLILFDDSALGVAENLAGAMAMIDRRQVGGDSLAEDPQLGPLLAGIDRQAAVWGVGLFPAGAELTSRIPLPGMPNLENLGFSIRLQPAIQLRLQTILPDADSATRMAGQISGLVKFAGGLLQANPQWLEKSGWSAAEVQGLLEGIFITAEGTAIKISLALPEGLLERLWRARGEGDALPPA